MKINRKFTPFSLEIESEEEVKFLREVLYFRINKDRGYTLLGRCTDSITEKALYLLSMLEKV